jgi:N-methylhydantoinase B/oxoprolinase/acetone carboxylase alpha subunit
MGGGEPGAAGKFQINGKPVRDFKKLNLQPDDVVLFETPGGGGYGHR